MENRFTKAFLSFFVFLLSWFSAVTDSILPIPKRLITGHNQDGKAIFDTRLNDEIPETVLSPHIFYLGYVTQGFPVDLESDADTKTYESYVAKSPGLSVPGGSVLRFVDFPPGKSAMHRTLSIDYSIVL
ncbi:cupin domain protein [Fusarium beomiforme]|uniref:Cupin domain protein n=1 Tax=Fusarium beomiforme TaxID=44412 RepID=A0A9P5AGP0_9HYPO|nr:cupin domain protein [Fusarium beomiforme]